MNYIVYSSTDVGIEKHINQDSFLLRVYKTKIGKIVLAVVCDGMGGLSMGEVASATVIHAFSNWADKKIINLCTENILLDEIKLEWISLVNEYNGKIRSYGLKCGNKMGTTVTAMLITPNRYYILNVGDSRAYMIKDNVKILTKDHSLVAREVELGKITVEQANRDSRKNILLQCIGVKEQVFPDIYSDGVLKNTTYMICSDGFRHEITNDEIFKYFNPRILCDVNSMKKNMDYLIQLNKSRNEKDNITAILIRTV